MLFLSVPKCQMPNNSSVCCIRRRPIPPFVNIKITNMNDGLKTLLRKDVLIAFYFQIILF